MGQGDGSGALTESGRTPLAVLLGDTGELERELDAALGRLTAESGTGEQDDSGFAAHRYPGVMEPRESERRERIGASRIGSPPARHHASVIGARIRSLAEEAYFQELQRNRREEDSSGSFAITPPRMPPAVGPASAEQEALANLPWELRQYLAPTPATQSRERPFMFGAAMGALIAVVAGGLTVGVLVGLPPERSAGSDAVPSLAGSVSAPGSVAPPQGSALVGSGPSAVSVQGGTPAGTGGAPGQGVAGAPVQGIAPPGSTSGLPEGTSPAAIAALVPGTGTSSPAIGGPQLVGRAQLTAALPVPAPSPKVGEAAPVALAPRRRVPRVVKEASLAAKEEVASMSFEEEPGTSPAEAVGGSTIEVDRTPPPTPQELDDAFEREFGVAGAPPAQAAEGETKPSVFIPPPVAQVPETLSQSQVMEVVVTHKKQIADCVSAHAEGSAERRTLVLSWVIAPGGAVENAQVDSEGLKGSPLGECVRSAVAGWKFAPHQQPQPVRFPFAY